MTVDIQTTDKIATTDSKHPSTLFYRSVFENKGGHHSLYRRGVRHLLINRRWFRCSVPRSCASSCSCALFTGMGAGRSYSKSKCISSTSDEARRRRSPSMVSTYPTKTGFSMILDIFYGKFGYYKVQALISSFGKHPIKGGANVIARPFQNGIPTRVSTRTPRISLLRFLEPTRPPRKSNRKEYDSLRYNQRGLL
jgi:hypothetical protein